MREAEKMVDPKRRVSRNGRKFFQKENRGKSVGTTVKSGVKKKVPVL